MLSYLVGISASNRIEMNGQTSEYKRAAGGEYWLIS
jgi:hypothetical protein